MLEDFDLKSIQDIEGARQAMVRLLNLIEELASDNRELRADNQSLRDENNQLKGEQGKPEIKPNRAARSGPTTPPPHSSEQERRQPRERKQSGKVECIQVNREEVLKVDPTQLPADAEFKGYDDVLVNLRFEHLQP